jgi:hypothetical protein
MKNTFVVAKNRYNSKFFQYYGVCGNGDRFLVYENRKTGKIESVKISRPENATIAEILQAVKNYK